MKIFIFLIFFLVLISLNVDAGPCTTATFCPSSPGDTSSVVCGVFDGICPEDYGDWSPDATGCDVNAYGGYCTPCDIDCEYCGLLDMEYIQTPQCGEDLVLTAKLYAQSTNGYVFLEKDGAFVAGSPQCTGDVCSEIIFTHDPDDVALKAPPTGGTDFEYKLYFTDLTLESARTSFTGKTTPCITVQSPVEGVTDPTKVLGKVTVNYQATSEDGITAVKLYILKDVSSGGAPDYRKFKPMKCDEECLEDGCNLVDTDTSGNQILTWDTTVCDNKNFILTVIAEDSRGSAAQGILTREVIVNNPGAPVFDEPSRILKLVVAKIKTWLL